MSFELSYCPNGQDVLSRLRKLYQTRSRDIILAKMNIPSKAVAEFAQTHKPGYCDYPDIKERVQFWDSYLKEQIEVNDDSIPSAYLTEMDQGLYGGLFDGDVRFLCDTSTGWISSMVPPLLKSWDDFEKLNFSTEHEWFGRYVEQLDMFIAGSNGKFGIRHFVLINGLNFLFELIGATQAYLDLTERPEMIEKTFDLAYKMNLEIHKTFFEKTPLLQGGTCSGMVQWIPGKIVAESIDPFHMTSLDYFEKWGRGPVEKIFSDFDGGIVHIHSNGRHLLGSVSTLKGLKAIRLYDEPGNPPALEVIKTLKERAGDVPIVCNAKFTEFCKALTEHTLVGGVLYDVSGVPDVQAANKWMDMVRGYKP